MVSFETSVIGPTALEALVDSLRARGYRVLGPTMRDGAIVYDDLESADRAAGRLDRQTGRRGVPARAARRRGALRLRGRPALLEAVPASRRGCASGRRGATATASSRSRRKPLDETPLAFIGVRACELHAIAIQDRVFLEGSYVERDYAARRERRLRGRRQLLRAGRHLLLRLDGHRPEGRGRLRPRPDRDPRRRAPAPGRGRQPSAGPTCCASCRGARPPRRRPRRRRRRGRRRRGADGPSGRARGTSATCSQRNLEHPRWDEVAERCLTCGNCTMVCPTCFCTTVEDTTDLAGESAERVRAGTRASRSTTRTSTAARPAVGPVALPAVAHPQVRHLARPVRHVGLRRLRTLHHLVPGRDRRDRGAGRDPRDGRRRMDTIETVLRGRARVRGARPPDELRLVAGCASNVRFDQGGGPVPRGRAGRHLLPRAARNASRWSCSSRPAAPSTIETIEAGEVVGWSWLFPPYRWHFDARALTHGARRRRSTVPACEASARRTPASATTSCRASRRC